MRFLQACAAFLHICGQTAEDDKSAKVFLDQGRRSLGGANRREQLLLAAAEDALGRNYDESATKLEALLRDWPQDLAAAKFLEFLYFALGQQFSGQRFLDAMSGIHDQNKDSGYFLSMYSFALELCGRYQDAIGAADRAIELEPDNPWAHHTLAHAYIESGALDEGTTRLESFQAAWRNGGQAIKSHDHWHLALMYLESLDLERAYKILPVILEDEPTIVMQKTDAISLLWRLEMAGFDVPEDDWSSLAESVVENSQVSHIAFNTAHYVYALGRAGQTDVVDQALDHAAQHADRQGGGQSTVWRTVGIPLLRGTAAFAQGRYKEAAEDLEAIEADVWQVGGSDAQVDLFRQTYLVTQIENGAKTMATAYLDSLVPALGATPLQDSWRARL